MCAKHVFWRDPTGKPYRGKDGKHSPCEVLAEIGKQSAMNSDGSLSWSFGIERFELALKLASVVICPSGEELNQYDAWGIVRRALIDSIKGTAKGKAPSAGKMLDLAEKNAADYFRKPEIPYTLVSSLSVKSLPVRQIKTAGCRIEALSSREKYPYPDLLGHNSEIKQRVEFCRGNQFVRVRTVGRTIHDGAARAFHALNLVRGLWSLFATYGSWSITFAGLHRKPIGVIHTGFIHTIHHPDGKPVDNAYWYERGMCVRQELFDPGVKWQRIEANRREAMKRIYRSPLKTETTDLIVRYALALDQADHEVAFLQMWSILEKLTNTLGANYDETLKRVIWLFKDRSLAKELLECIRLQRNLYVHAAKSSDEPDQLSYLIKSLVDSHLIHLIRNDFRTSTLEEYGQHLSLPTNLATLHRNKRWATKAIQMFRKKKVGK